jgi:hypothetical protein
MKLKIHLGDKLFVTEIKKYLKWGSFHNKQKIINVVTKVLF